MYGRRWVLLTALTAAVVAWMLMQVQPVPPLPAQLLPPPVLDPQTYVSPSGGYSLSVTPSSPHGEGGAAYRLKRGTTTVWASRKPYTLYKAGVADDGTAAGFSYSDGLDGFALGDFRIVILGPNGKERLNESTPRHRLPVMDAGSAPTAEGVLVDGENDRLLLRVYDSDPAEEFGRSFPVPSWRAYRLSTGRRLSSITPAMANPDYEFGPEESTVVRGTPLILVRWDRVDQQRHRLAGARFTLMDESGKIVWTHDLPHDYESPDGDDATEKLQYGLSGQGLFISSAEPRRFTIRSVRAKEFINFSIQPHEKGTWTVAEENRRPIARASAHRPTASIRRLAPRYLGATKLAPNAAASSADFVWDFTPAGPHRIAYVPCSCDRVGSLVLATDNGKVIRTLDLRALGTDYDANVPRAVWAGGDSFLVFRERVKDGGVWKADIAKGSIIRLPDFHTSNVKHVSAMAGGGFAAIVDDQDPGTLVSRLVACDKTGKRLWSHEASGRGPDASILLSLDDVTVTRDGRVVTIDSVSDKLVIFNRDGRYVQTVELAKAWKRSPAFPSDLRSCPDGDILVGDFQGKIPIVKMTPEGTVRGQIRPLMPDSRPLEPRQFAMDSQNRLWIADDAGLERLNNRYVVDRSIGPGSSDAPATQIDDVQVLGDGRIYAIDHGKMAVRRYDAAGKPNGLFASLPSDFPAHSGSVGFAVDRAGDVYMFYEGGPRELVFRPDGKRIGFRRRAESSSTPNEKGRAGAATRWMAGHNAVLLFGSGGNLLRKVQRHADGRWFRWVDLVAPEPNGSVALIDQTGYGMTDQPGSPSIVTECSAEGVPVRTFSVPFKSDPRNGFGGIAAVPGRIVIANGPAVTMFRDSHPAWTFQPSTGGKKHGYWRPFIVRGGTELWLWDGANTIRRYDLRSKPPGSGRATAGLPSR